MTMVSMRMMPLSMVPLHMPMSMTLHLTRDNTDLIAMAFLIGAVGLLLDRGGGVVGKLSLVGVALFGQGRALECLLEMRVLGLLGLMVLCWNLLLSWLN